MLWLPEPPSGTKVCLAFDGSETSDFTVIRAETREGHLFTPRWGSGGTIWDPEQHGGRVPKAAVTEAVADLFARFDVARMYCDPPYWGTEIEEWAAVHGEERVIKWPTYRPVAMHSATERFLADLSSGRITHDGCPITARHMANARIAPRRDGRYMLAKPDVSRKIDAAVATVLVHEAAADVRSEGWETADTTVFVFRR
jgi:phage terminase large subunit-like protein